jgi:hypothetical protein
VLTTPVRSTALPRTTEGADAVSDTLGDVDAAAGVPARTASAPTTQSASLRIPRIVPRCMPRVKQAARALGSPLIGLRRDEPVSSPPSTYMRR